MHGEDIVPKWRGLVGGSMVEFILYFDGWELREKHRLAVEHERRSERHSAGQAASKLSAASCKWFLFSSQIGDPSSCRLWSPRYGSSVCMSLFPTCGPKQSIFCESHHFEDKPFLLQSPLPGTTRMGLL